MDWFAAAFWAYMGYVAAVFVLIFAAYGIIALICLSIDVYSDIEEAIEKYMEKK